nr:threonine-phosphate decarboxylase [Gilvimarinus xylanilyticus]
MRRACERYGIPLSQWQDLSTGISPWGFPVGAVPETVWRDLPVDTSALQHAAADYYGVSADAVVPAPGSQAAISIVPGLLPPAVVALPACGYTEHEIHWQNAGHTPLYYHTPAQLLQLAKQGAVTHAVIINPNNPTAEFYSAAGLRQLHNQLTGYLLVDEAFMDFDPAESMATSVADCERLCVLRSLGKFFGLAGLRLGFLLSRGEVAERFRARLDPWAVSHPALWVGEQALQNRQWQARQVRRIALMQSRLMQLLTDFIDRLDLEVALSPAGLFVSLSGPAASLEHLHGALARRAIFTRWGYRDCNAPRDATDQPYRVYLRVGLPPDGGVRLKAALNQIEQEWTCITL